MSALVASDLEEHRASTSRPQNEVKSPAVFYHSAILKSGSHRRESQGNASDTAQQTGLRAQDPPAGVTSEQREAGILADETLLLLG